MAKISENMIPDINADWGLDASNNLPYSGEAVQEFIKRTLKQKYGYFHYDEIGNRYMVFADKDSYDLYAQDKEANKDLLLNVFDAPFNYSARIELITEAYNAVLLGSTGNLLQFKFFLENKNGDSTGENADCTITFTNAGVKKVLNQMYTSAQGRDGVSIDLSEYITEGTNNISIVIKGQDHLASTTVSVIYQVVNLQLSDVFDISKVYNPGDNLIIPVTVGGYGSKTLEWYVDGVLQPFDQSIDQINSPITITNTKTISLENIDSGVHSIQVRVYTIVEGKQFYSQTLFRNFFVRGDSETLVGVAAELPIGVDPVIELSQLYGLIQYVPYNLRYAIYNPANTVSNEVSVYIDKELYTTDNAVNGSESNLAIVVNESGNRVIKISVNGSIYTLSTDIIKSSIDIYEITSNLSLDLRAFGRSNDLNNTDNNSKWDYKGVTSSFNGFYWNAQSGWVDNSLIVNAGATLEIKHAPLAVNPTILGKTLEFEFATRNVISDDSVVLDLTTNGVGLLITASEVKLTASDKSVVSTKFKAGENNRVSFVINKNENDTNACLMFIYVNGIICGATNYAKTANIRCSKNMVFNSDVDIIIKQIRFYDRSLNSDEILNNYILYRDTVSEMLDIYTRNDIYDSMSEIDPEKIVNYLPVMYFTCLLNDSKNTVLGGIPTLEARTDADAKNEEIYCSIKYVNAQDPTKNFSIDRSRVRLQGTSSIKYPKKNWRFYTGKKYGVMLDHKGNVIPDGKYSFKKGSISTDRWCLKADYAESSSSHNTGTARIWNDLLTKAQVTYSNPEKSSYFVLQGVREDGSVEFIYNYYDKENEKLNDATVLEQKFVTYKYIPITREEVTNTGLASKAIPVAGLPDESDNGFKSNLFVMLPDENGVVGELALMTNAQKAAKDNGYNYDVRTCIDGFPIVVFYRLTENDPWIFLGKHNFNNEKSSENVFGFCDIPGFDDSVIPGSITEDNPEGYTYGEKMQCWELLNNNDELGFFSTTEGFYDLVPDGKGGQIYRWEQAFEARYPDEGSAAPTGDLKRFADWMSTVSQEDFEDEKWAHLDVYKMAAYYIYLMRFGAADQVVKNSMFTSEDGEHFYFINYDNDTILGVKNDGRLVFDPTIDRQTPDPDFPDAFAYAGHDSRMWNMLEADKEFMDVVKAVDSALGSAGMTYESMIDMFENKQTGQWCERIYNRDAQLKYINPYNTGVYDEGLFSLQGTRNSHRRWWLSQRFNIYDAKFITGSFKTQNIWFKLNGAPIGSHFDITSGKYLPYGYEITNGASEVTDFIPVNDTYRFVIPQGVSVGDPVLIYGATNIKKLDMSNVMPYLSQISLAGSYSDSVGTMLEELDLHGKNEASNVTISGLEYLTSLKTFNVRGIKGIKELNLPNSLNIKSLYARGSGLSSVNLAPGCLIEELELPTSTEAVVLEDLPLLTHDNLVLEGNWANVHQIKISGCPNITNNFDLIWNWYDKTRDIEVRSVDIQGVNWEGVHIDQLIELGQNTNILLRGSIKLLNVSAEDKFKLLTLKELYGENIFNTDSDLHIYGPNSIFVFGPEDGIVLEGDSYQFETIVFSDESGTLVYNISEGERAGVNIDRNTGLITTIENGEKSEDLTIVSLFVSSSNDRFLDEYKITVQKRVYPQSVSIKGSGRISEETTKYIWETPTQNITGFYKAEWTLSGEVLNYVKVQYQSEEECVINRLDIPETIASGVLTLKLYKLDNSVISTTSMILNVVNPDIIMAMDTNPEVLTILMERGLAKGEYLLKSDAKAITNLDIYVDDTHSIFTSSNITHFEELQYFTGLTTIPAFCFSGCGKLEKITLPETIKSIELNAFQNTALTYIYIPASTTNIDLRAFSYSKQLINIDVDNYNTVFCSKDGNLYVGARPYTLYTIAPGALEYIMPEETTNVYGDGDVAWSIGSLLRKIILNDKVKGVTGRWFMYGFSDLIEINGPERDDIKFYNGCIYNSDYSKLIYWPSGKAYFESDLHKNVNEFGERSFSQNKLLREVSIPKTVTKLGEWAYYNTSMLSLDVHENVTEIGSYCFSWNSLLKTVDVKTPNISTGNLFIYCSELCDINLAGISMIPDSMFSNCSKLLSITIPETIVSIGSYAFSNSGLTSIEIPSLVRSIGQSCFMGCVKLGDINCLAESAPSLGSEVFGNNDTNYTGSAASMKQLYVPSNSTGYESGDWKTVLQDIIGFTLNKTL